ncbi:Shedu immune nuclease family protein [Mucilaginibacter lappiensis]|uniref:Shedu immune nuclease family protein n=1 Tax=Mucilaginibacter lappiensis TaxID=354630 RepID=UPI003D214DB8
MAIPYPSDSLQPEGSLEVEQISDNLYRGYFTPPLAAITSYEKDPSGYKRCVLEVDKTAKTITIVPFRVWSVIPMSNRYSKLGEIVFELSGYAERYLEEDWDLESLLSMTIPEIFTQDINYGFGFKKHYTQIASILEELGIKKLVITAKEKTSVETAKHTATIHESDLERFRRTVDTIIRRSQSLTANLKRDALNVELFAALDSTGMVSKAPGKLSKEEFVALVGKTNRFVENGATPAEQKEALTVIRKNANKIFEQQPQELIKLKNDLELVNLEQLIEKFEVMIEKGVGEAQWQNLFQQNPFIISMAFGIPVVNVQGQASVGGRRLSGGGEKIADFLVKNSLSNNTAIVEIKTPATNLVYAKAYRSSVHGPSQELSAAVSQVLDQVYLLQKEINNIKVNSKTYNIETYHVHGILIAGLTPQGTDEQKSFEYFRANSKNVQIITFDELLEKLKSLYQFLLPDKPPAKTPTNGDEDDLPF